MKYAWVGLSIVLIVCGLLVPVPARAASSVVINEFMPHPISGEDWVELYNTSSNDIPLTNWVLKDNTTSAMKTLSGVLAANSYLSIDVSTRLNNGGDSVVLLDANSVELDRYDFTADPGAGISIGRYPNGMGTFAVLATVSKGASNGGETTPSPTPAPTSATSIIPTASPTPNPTQSSTPNPTMTPSPTANPTASPSFTPTPTVSPSPLIGGATANVRLSEYLPAPAVGEYEWVELYNASPFEANVASWQIDDAEGGSSPLLIPSDTNAGFIPPLSYKVYVFTSAKLNNSGDTVRLLKPDGTVVDQVAYTSAQTGISFARDPNGQWQETTTPTPSEANTITAPDEQASPTPSPSATPKASVSLLASTSIISASSTAPVILGLSVDNQEATQAGRSFNTNLPFLSALFPKQVLVQSTSDNADPTVLGVAVDFASILTYLVSFLAVTALGGGYYLYTSGRMSIWLQKVQQLLSNFGSQ